MSWWTEVENNGTKMEEERMLVKISRENIPAGIRSPGALKENGSNYPLIKQAESSTTKKKKRIKLSKSSELNEKK